MKKDSVVELQVRIGEASYQRLEEQAHPPYRLHSATVQVSSGQGASYSAKKDGDLTEDANLRRLY